jgi:hypothetical protein
MCAVLHRDHIFDRINIPSRILVKRKNAENFLVFLRKYYNLDLTKVRETIWQKKIN